MEKSWIGMQARRTSARIGTLAPRASVEPVALARSNSSPMAIAATNLKNKIPRGVISTTPPAVQNAGDGAILPGDPVLGW